MKKYIAVLALSLSIAALAVCAGNFPADAPDNLSASPGAAEAETAESAPPAII